MPQSRNIRRILVRIWLVITFVLVSIYGKFAVQASPKAMVNTSEVVEDLSAVLGVPSLAQYSKFTAEQKLKAAKGFYQHDNEKWKHAIVYDQKTMAFYYATAGKTASSGSSAIYRTLGYEIKIKGTPYSVDVLRKPEKNAGSGYSYNLVEIASGAVDGKTYSLFCITLDTLNTIFSNKYKQTNIDFTDAFFASDSNVVMTADAYLCICNKNASGGYDQNIYIGDYGNNGSYKVVSGNGHLYHSLKDANSIGWGGDNGNYQAYFDKNLHLKGGGYGVTTTKVSLVNKSDDYVYHGNSAKNAYYISGEQGKTYAFSFTAGLEKKNIIKDMDADNDLDLLKTSFDFMLEQEWKEIRARQEAASNKENGTFQALLREESVYVYELTSPKEGEETQNKVYECSDKKGGMLSSTNKNGFWKFADGSNMRSYVEGDRVKLDGNVVLSVSNFYKMDGLTFYMMPYGKAIRNATSIHGVGSKRYQQDKALLLTVDNTAPKKTGTLVLKNGYYCIPFEDPLTDNIYGSGLKKAVIQKQGNKKEQTVSILDGVEQTDPNGIKRVVKGFAAIPKSVVTPGEQISLFVYDNVGNKSEEVTFKIPQNAKNVTLTYAMHELGHRDVSDTKMMTSETGVRFTVAVYPYQESGYVFSGWSKEANASKRTVEHKPGETITITNDTTLYPVFKKLQSIKLTYVMSEVGYSNVSTDPVVVGQGEGATFTVAVWPYDTCPVPGYYLEGWSTNSDVTTRKTEYKAGTQIRITKDTNLYPVFKLYTLKYKVYYKVAVGDSLIDFYSPQEVVYTASHSVMAAADGVSWELYSGSLVSGKTVYQRDPNNPGSDRYIFKHGDVIQPYSDITFIAVCANGLTYWNEGKQVGKQIDVTFNATSDFTLFGAPDKPEGKRFYHFKHWSVRGENLTLGAGAEYKGVSGLKDLDAVWEADVYKVVFHSNSPQNCSTKRLGKMQWQPDGLDHEVWQDVRFTQDGSIGCEISLPGYEFLGWNGAKDGTGQNFGDKLEYSATWIEHGITPNSKGEIHLYAAWKPIAITVEFALNKPDTGNHYRASSATPSFVSGNAVMRVAFDEKIETLPIAKLLGWHDAADGEDLISHWFRKPYRWDTGGCLTKNGQIDFSLAGDPRELEDDGNGGKKVVLYAIWDPNTYTIYYEKNPPQGASTTDPLIWGWEQPPQEVTYDSPVRLTALNLTTPSVGNNTDVLPGYHWVKWVRANGETYGNGELINNLTPDRNGSVYLYAEWKPDTYTIFYRGNKPEKENNTHASSENPVLQYGSQTSTSYIAVPVVWDSGLDGKVPEAQLTGWHPRYDAETAKNVWYMGNHYTNPGNRVSQIERFAYETVGYPGNKNVYAQWQANWYYIQYHENGQNAVTGGNIEKDSSLEAQVKEYRAYMLEHAYTDTFEKCVPAEFRKDTNTRIYFYDREAQAAKSQFIRYDQGVALEHTAHFEEPVRYQIQKYTEASYAKYGLDAVKVSYLIQNPTWNQKYDYRFLGWDIYKPVADNATHQWSYDEGADLKNLTVKFQEKIPFYGFWNAYPNFDARNNRTHFSVYEGADITMEMLKNRLRIYDKEEGLLPSSSVEISEIRYADGTNVKNPNPLSYLETSEKKIGFLTITFLVRDKRGEETVLVCTGRIHKNNEPKMEEPDKRYFYLKNIEGLSEEALYELLLRPIKRRDVEDDAYQKYNFLKQDDIFEGRVEPAIGFGKKAWYLETSTKKKIYQFTQNDKEEGLRILHTGMKEFSKKEQDEGKELEYVVYTNDCFKKQTYRLGEQTIVDSTEDDAIPENGVRKRVRFIAKEYVESMPEQSVWKRRADYKKALWDSLWK